MSKKVIIFSLLSLLISNQAYAKNNSKSIVESIFVDDISADYKIKMVFPNVIGNEINIKDIDQGLAQLNRLGSNNYSYKIINLKNNNKKLVLTNSRGNMWDGAFIVKNGYDYFDNHLQKTLYFNTYDTFNSNEHWFLSYKGFNFFSDDATSFRSANYNHELAINVDIPYGYWTFYLDNKFTHGKTRDEFMTNNLYISKSMNYKHSFTASRLIYKDDNSSTNASLKFTYFNPHKAFGGIYNSQASRNLNLVRLGVTHEQNIFNADWKFDAGITNSMKLIGYSSDDNNNFAEHAQFYQFDYTMNFKKEINMFDEDFKINSKIGMVVSDRQIVGEEKIEITDRDNVRGFAHTPLAGDIGIYARNELIENLPNFYNNIGVNKNWQKKLGKPELYYAFDIGTAKNIGASYQSVSSISLGYRSEGNKTIFDLAYTIPTSSPDGFDVDDSLIYLKAGWKF